MRAVPAEAASVIETAVVVVAVKAEGGILQKSRSGKEVRQTKSI